MPLALLAAIAFAPIYWLAVPVRWRREVLSIASLAGLTLYDVRLLPLLIVFTLALAGLMQAICARPGRLGTTLATAGLLLLTALFMWNKLAGAGPSVLPSQTGLVFLGISYLALKSASALVETARGSVRTFSWPEVTSWIVFLPTYPSGPMEDFDHFRRQWPSFDHTRVLGGLERILFGLVKVLLVSHYLGEWVGPIVAAPAEQGPVTLLLGTYAFALRFYFDFAGYSDIAIGLAALFGYEIEENFDNPFLRRNLVQLWQRWHMTLTRWLRVYLFIPVSRRLMRLSGGQTDWLAIAIAQVASMTFCGLWHGLAWNFALWGLLQAVGLFWVGVLCRDLARYLPVRVVAWWRRSRLAYAASTALTFNFFALSSVFVVKDVAGATEYLRLLFRL